MSQPTHNDARVLLRLYRQVWTAESQAAWSFVRSDDFKREPEAYQPGTSEWTMIGMVIGQFETLGALHKRHLINEDLLFDASGGYSATWERTQALIFHERAKNNDPLLYENFELVVRAAGAWQKRHLAELAAGPASIPTAKPGSRPTHEDALLFLELTDLTEIPEARAAWRFVWSDEAKREPASFKRDTPEWDQINLVLGQCEVTGTLYKYHLIHEDLLFDILGTEYLWKRLEPFALYARAQNNNPALYENFELLARGGEAWHAQQMAAVGAGATSSSTTTAQH